MPTARGVACQLAVRAGRDLAATDLREAHGLAALACRPAVRADRDLTATDLREAHGLAAWHVASPLGWTGVSALVTGWGW